MREEATEDTTKIEGKPISKREKPNHPPKADAGRDLSVNENEEVALTADGSSDSDGDELSFVWNQVSPRKSNVELKNSNSEKAKFVAPEIDTQLVLNIFRYRA